jgi:hypothetical protein
LRGNLFTPPSPWGAFVILVPVIGGIAVGYGGGPRLGRTRASGQFKNILSIAKDMRGA